MGGGGDGGEQGKGEGETGRSGKGEKGKDPPTKHSNISPTSKHSNCSTALKNLFLLSPSPLLPSLQVFLFIILDKLNLIVTTSCIESQTQSHNNYSCKPELGRGRANPPTWMSVTHTASCILLLTFLPMQQAISLPLAKLSQIMFSLIQQVCSLQTISKYRLWNTLTS